MSSSEESSTLDNGQDPLLHPRVSQSIPLDFAQRAIGVWDNMVTVMANSSDHVEFVNLASNSSFEATYTTSYDGKLLKPFAKVLDDPAARKFIVLHLLGNHSSYKKRYPKAFDEYRGTSRKSEHIAEYDNSILYTDYVVDSLLTILEQKSSPSQNTLATAIFTSDHGENVYDEQDKVGHDYVGILPKSNVEVPFILWQSGFYKEQFNEKFSGQDSLGNRPFVSDDLFHSIMDLNEIASPYLDLSKSIFSNDFKADRQRILEDGMDYDRK